MTRRSFSSPAQVSERLALRFPTLYTDAEHALIAALVGYGNGREWHAGCLAALDDFDHKSREELLADRAATEARWAEERRRGEEEARNRPADPDLDALIESIFEDNRREAQRRASDPAYDARLRAEEAARRRVDAMLQDPTYRKQAWLMSLCSTSNMANMPARASKQWVRAARWVARRVIEVSETFQEAVYPGAKPRLNPSEARRVAVDLIARLG